MSETLLPNSTTDQAGWSSDHAAIDEGVSAQDGDTTNTTDGGLGDFIAGFANPTAGTTFTSITMRVVVRRVAGAGSVEIVPRINSVELTPRESPSLTTSYVVYEYTWNGSWSLADMNTLEVVFGNASGSVRVTAVEAVVESDVAVKTPYQQWAQRSPILAQ